jgi:Uma2 family endonuclease
VKDSALEHPLPWTEPEFWALGATASRVELIDGSLLVGPRPGRPHRSIAVGLVRALDRGARACGRHAGYQIRLRLGVCRVASPDVVVVNDVPRRADGLFVEAAETTLVGEVVSVDTTLSDIVLKRQLYADAGIGWYLLAEPSLPDYESVTLRLLRLAGDHYVRHAVADPGQVLKTAQPFPFEIRPVDLLTSTALPRALPPAPR